MVLSSGISKLLKTGSFREGQYPQYYQVHYGDNHQYSHPGRLIPGPGDFHPDNDAEDEIDQRDEKQDSPPARTPGNFAHQVQIGDWYPGKPGITGICFIGNDVKSKRQPDIYHQAPERAWPVGYYPVLHVSPRSN